MKNIFLSSFIGLFLSVSLLVSTAFETLNAQNKIVAISIDSMNVLYKGLDNPITIAIEDVSSTKISVTINNGTITGINGKYIVKPANIGNAIIDVMVDGKKNGSKQFRVKSVPDPISYIGGLSGSFYASKDQLAQFDKLEARIPNFPLNLSFEVISFELTIEKS